MIRIPSRFWTASLLLLATFGWVTAAAAQTVTASPTAAPSAPAGDKGVPVAGAPAATPGQTPSPEMVRTDPKGRHLAPRGTFYLLSYVAVKTDKGVEGFDPGQEVHLVEVHRATHTLVVSDGHAQVEVSPSQLTNDMGIAVLVRQKDNAQQAQIEAYIQSEQAAYAKAQQRAADATAKDLAQRKQEQSAPLTAADAASGGTTSAPQADASYGDDGYYNPGGYGYGSPYEYFVDVPVGVPARAKAPASAPLPAPAPVESKVAVPTEPVAGGRVK